MYIPFFTDERGSAGLVVIMVIFAIVSLVLGGVIFFGVDDLETGYAELKSSESLLSAESCAEEAVLRIKRDANYSGGEVIVGNSTCGIVITGNPCGTCEVNITSVTGIYARHLRMTVTKTGSLVNITSWQEID